MSSHITDTFNVCAISSRGLEPGESAFSSFEEQISTYINAIIKMQPQGPYHIGGYSSGGVAAHEIVSRLEKTGSHVASLTLIDSKSPAQNTNTPFNHYTKESNPNKPDDGILDIAVELGIDISGQTEESIANKIVENAIRARIVPKGTPVRWAVEMAKEFRRNALWTTNHSPQKINAKTYYLYALDRSDSKTTIEEDAREWRMLANNIELRPVEGNHNSLLNDYEGKLIAEHINEYLED